MSENWKASPKNADQMRVVRTADGEVPEWKMYFPSLAAATPQQRKFYEYWLSKLEQGTFIDIEGNITYVFVYLYEVIENFVRDRDIGKLLFSFEKIGMAYDEHNTVQGYFVDWTADAYLYQKSYDKAWLVIRNGRRSNVEEVKNLKSRCTNTSIDGHDLIWLLGSDSGLTDFGKRNKEQLAELVTAFVRDFHNEHGGNLIEDFCSQFDFARLGENDYSAIRRCYEDEKEFLFWKQDYERGSIRYPYRYGRYLFCGVPLLSRQPFEEFEAIPNIVTVAFKNESRRILRECENRVREVKNIPRVGEGWVSETELFHKLCEVFPHENIIHHARPDWLSPQHIDIYFPLRKIGCEFQGPQHEKPVNRFGGEKALEKQRERDRRKRELCEANGCKLIYVSEGYDFEEIKHRIDAIIAGGSCNV